MKFKFTLIAIAITSFLGSIYAQGGCTTVLPSLDNASAVELCQEYKRLKSYKNPYCDTTNSVFHDVMNRIGDKVVEEKLSKEAILEAMGDPYYHGTLADYESQKVTLGRDGKQKGKALPPGYKIPTGEYYIVYLWRDKDYLTIALKGNQAMESRWWEKGNYH